MGNSTELFAAGMRSPLIGFAAWVCKKLRHLGEKNGGQMMPKCFHLQGYEQLF